MQVRLVQKLLRRRRDAMPFMDMVSNRFTLFSYNALLFVYPFCLLSTFVIGGSVLIEPSRSFAPAGPPARLAVLCSPVVTSALHTLASDVARDIAVLPNITTASKEQVRA